MNLALLWYTLGAANLGWGLGGKEKSHDILCQNILYVKLHSTNK
jgi:hypothetical protein